MNIFATSEDPHECALYLDDKRVGKLLMEANQMLSLAVKIHYRGDPVFLGVGPGQLTQGFAHRNHPVSVWARRTRGNFEWLADHARALSIEFSKRFNRRHESSYRTDYILRFAGDIPDGPLEDFQNSARNDSLGLDFTWIHPTTEAYRAYLRARWETDKIVPRWTRRGEPRWRDASR